MRSLMSLGMAVLMAASVSLAGAAEIESGLQAGKFIGPFNVTKCAGPEDGVDIGKTLCYRCKYGSQPQVMVFTRTSDEHVAKLVKGLDAAVKQHSDKNLGAFVNFLGRDKEALSSEAKKFAKANKVDNVPLVVPNEFENGPENYGLNPKAGVTVILAADGKVKASHAAASAEEINLDALLSDVEKILE